jgi:hypothetical protein
MILWYIYWHIVEQTFTFQVSNIQSDNKMLQEKADQFERSMQNKTSETEAFQVRSCLISACNLMFLL